MNDFAPIEQLCRDVLSRTAAQRDSEGAAFAPRRPKPDRGRKKGRLRPQKMFRKIRMAKSLKADGNADKAWVGFGGRASRIASIHQEGLADAPAPGQPKVRYARRVLLGLTDAERKQILDLIIGQLAPR